MTKYIVTVYVKDNRKFGLGERTLKILVLGKGNVIDKVTNYFNNSSIQYFKIISMQLEENEVSVEEIYDAID